ncbi:MAG: hypothetical protein ACU836_18775 [Gammaproteobacteria bacterium]
MNKVNAEAFEFTRKTSSIASVLSAVEEMRVTRGNGEATINCSPANKAAFLEEIDMAAAALSGGLVEVFEIMHDAAPIECSDKLSWFLGEIASLTDSLHSLKNEVSYLEPGYPDSL